MTRILQITSLSLIVLYLIGCKGPVQSEPLKDQIKIGDLASSDSTGQSANVLQNTINFSVYIFEAPAENINRLDSLWSKLSTIPLRFNKYEAFKDNAFVAGAGQAQLWNPIQQQLQQAGAQRMVNVTLLLPDGQVNDFPITSLSSKNSISFVSANRSSHRVVIGPGIIVLRVKVTKLPASTNGTPPRGNPMCMIAVQPVFKLPEQSPIPELSVSEKAYEFPFTSAAFGLRMNPGDFVVLGPGQYDDLTTLCGLVFSNPAGRLFFTPNRYKTPERMPAFRIFLLVCEMINY